MRQTSAPERKISVVISTLNRSGVLRKCLESLRYQTHRSFEVIVVNGPSTDDTEAVIAAYGDSIKVGRLNEANLSKSRNVGISLSSGEIVAFLDDDAYAEPNWLRTIDSGYDDASVGGVGTRVFDHTGFGWQTNPFTVDKYYNPDFERMPPVWAFNFKDSSTIPHVLGASSSVRRDLLKRIGGFDEEIEYFLDESEVCRRVKEIGYTIRFLDYGAAVHHKYASGVTRDERRILTHPYPVVKNKYYVCLSDALRSGESVSEALSACEIFYNNLLAGAKWQLDNGGIAFSEYEKFAGDLARGRQHGMERATASGRKSIQLREGPTFRPFPRILDGSQQLTICLISKYLPQSSPGGVARFMYDLAEGFAARGHEVHLISKGAADYVDFENGIWTHTLGDSAIERNTQRDFFKSGAAVANLAWARAAHEEVLRLREARKIDLVVAPAWDQEGIYCALDRSLTTIVSMNTTFKTYSEIERGKVDAVTQAELLPIEAQYIQAATFIHANSQATAKHVVDNFQPRNERTIVVVGHGCRDVEKSALPTPATPKTESSCTILYLSRLEKRKGTDQFLGALPLLLANNPSVKVRIAGRNSYEGESGPGYERAFFATNPGLKSRVAFLGEITDEEALSEFEGADIFCVPSRYESFGIIFLEAMRHSLPVVACAVGGVTDIVTPEIGQLVPPNNVDAIRAALEVLIRDPSLRRKKGAAARLRFSEKFEHNVIVDETLKQFISLIEARSNLQEFH